MMTSEKVEVTDEIIAKASNYHGQVMVSNPLRNCNRHIKPVKKNGAWGRTGKGWFDRFTCAYIVYWKGKEAFIKFEVEYDS